MLHKTLKCVPLAIWVIVPWTVRSANGQAVYWTQTGPPRGIYRADFDGSDAQEVFTAASPAALAIDARGGKVYWRDGFNVRRGNVDGTQVETLLSVGAFLGGLAVDGIAGKFYWLEYTRVGRANLDGSSPETVISVSISNPADIALDLVNGKVYWVWNEQDTFGGKFERCNLDGTEYQDITPANRYLPWAIALDVAASKMYWTDQNASSRVIRRADLDGSNAETVVVTGTNLGQLLGIALDPKNGYVFWTHGALDKIHRSNLDGSGVMTWMTGTDSPWAIDLLLPPIYADVFPPDGNDVLDVDDILRVLDGFTDPGQFPEADVFPCNGNGVIDVDDILAALDAFSGNPACVWSNGMWVPN